ncbi:MAG: hypothetical protein COU47_03030 [Candidatus Niyogibacteria bacterium CG10_big_fil_rev_8_21_14_0_10_46_36]|uniref:Peptidase M50 domain-containing protein n=1 Tax=Candidatus Niyogibacteria bacterium CG10_big_fil_rev_8_21_14_0_10_46_36 TaxID=1974726 RepID=A0A2H0TD79_9BACT|nr:MAG: hypothetical protein COU47_03030 [Candidatus Niyogibacteria bacterium CG10_big_fil_rev_8_21_14_0_10_46_36]
MILLVTILLLVCAVALHELGHAILMKRYSVTIKEICILGVGPKLFTFRWRRMFGDTPIHVRLLPIAAFVRLKYPEETENLGYAQREHIYSGGIAMNFLFAGVLIFFVCCFGAFHGHFSLVLISIFFIVVALGGTLWFFPCIAGMCVLILGFISLGSLLYMVTVLSPTETIAGPIGIGSYIAGIHSYTAAVVFSAVMSANIGILNALPLGMLDGELITMSFLNRKFPTFMTRFGNMVYVFLFLGFLSIVALAFGSDTVRLLQPS